MQKLFFKPYIFVFASLFGILIQTACDRFKADFRPEANNSSGKLTTKANQPVIKDITKLHNLQQPATFNLKGQPKFGEAKFIKAGLLMYSPNEDISATSDSIKYEICIDEKCENKLLVVEVLPQGTEPQPEDVCEQGAFADIAYLSLPNNQNTIEVLANDAFCDNPVDPNTLQIIYQPQLGVATLQDGKVIYQIDPSKFVGGESDGFMYQVAEKNNPENVRYAWVTILIEPESCDLVVRDDYFQIEINGWISQSPLLNDNFCGELLMTDTLEAIKVIKEPLNGTTYGVSYKPKLDFEGTDEYTYQLKYKDGTAKQGIVKIRVNGGVSCKNIPPQAKDDVYTFRIGEVATVYHGLNTFYNDVICYPSLDYTKSKITQNIPSNQGIVIMEVWGDYISIGYKRPTPAYIGKITFKYQVCDVYNRCSEATVTLNITD
jgi:hypothetical protein